jgi:hypothetical protein
VALALGALVAARPASAAEKRAGVPKFEGEQEALVRKKVMAALKAHGYQLVKSREMEVGVANSGALLESDDGFQKVAKELALAVIVTGEVGKRKAKIVIHDGREGSVLGQATFAGANPRKVAAEVGRGFWKKLGGDVARGRTPAGAKKPQAGPVAEAAEDKEDEGGASDEGGEHGGKAEASGSDNGGESRGEDEGRRRRRSKTSAAATGSEGSNTISAEAEPSETVSPSSLATLDLAVGPRAITRSLSYHQDRSGLRPYSLSPGSAVAAGAVWYPLASFMNGPARGFGVEASLEQGFLIQSAVTLSGSNVTFGNVVHEYAGGVRYRLPFGAGHYAYVSAGGGEHAFTFTSGTNANRGSQLTDLPDTIYRYARGGLGVGLTLPANLSVVASAGYRYVFNRGGDTNSGIGSAFFFPHATVAGVDAEVTVGYRLTDNIEIRGGADWRRYFFSMHSQANDPMNGARVAGGAVDQYISFNLLGAFTWGGAPRGGSSTASDDETPPPPPEATSKRKRGDDEKPDEGGGSGGGDADE